MKCFFAMQKTAVEGKRHFRFSPLRVATGCRLCTCEKGRPGLSPHVSIPCPCLYGLVRSCLHTRGRCELSSASERGPHVGIPLDTFHSVTSVGLTPYLEGSAGSVALNSSYDPVWFHIQIFSQPPSFQRGSSYCCEQRQRGFFSSAQRSNRGGFLFGSTPQLLQPVFSSFEEGWGFAVIGPIPAQLASDECNDTITLRKSLPSPQFCRCPEKVSAVQN